MMRISVALQNKVHTKLSIFNSVSKMAPRSRL